MSASSPEEWAARATRAQAAMERSFRRRGGQMRRDGGGLHFPWTRAHLWPFTRGLISCADLAGVPAQLRPGSRVEADLAAHEETLEHYWDRGGPTGAYASDLPPRLFGTSRYHDDNAWVGLGLVQLERMDPGARPGRLSRIAELWRFAVSGWDRRPDVAHPGGVFWVAQGQGLGRRNHDRNTVSTAPNAQIALHLAELTRGAEIPSGPAAARAPGPERMLEWVQEALGDDDLYWDKIRGDGTIDRAVWSYNQGSMLGAHALLARAAGARGDSGAVAEHLARGERIARRSVTALTALEDGLDSQPAAFHAIWFRNLLLLGDVSSDEQLMADVRATVAAYGARCWARHRRSDDLFTLPSSRGAVTLLDQSAMVQIFSLLAWPRDQWRLLA